MAANQNRPVVPPLVKAQRKQDAAHAGEPFHAGQRVLDLVTKREGTILGANRGANREDLTFMVILDAVPVKPDEGVQLFDPPSSFTLLSQVNVVRKTSELCELPDQLRVDAAEFDNPKL